MAKEHSEEQKEGHEMRETQLLGFIFIFSVEDPPITTLTPTRRSENERLLALWFNATGPQLRRLVATCRAMSQAGLTMLHAWK